MHADVITLVCTHVQAQLSVPAVPWLCQPHLCELSIIMQTAPQTQVGCVAGGSPGGPALPAPAPPPGAAPPLSPPSGHACTPQAPSQRAVLARCSGHT